MFVKGRKLDGISPAFDTSPMLLTNRNSSLNENIAYGFFQDFLN